MKNKHLKVVTLLLAATATLLAAGYILAAGVPTQTQETQRLQPAVTEPAAYVVRSYNGKVAVYTVRLGDMPTIETDIAVEGLRAYDRRLLETGIAVDSYDAVLSLFEDLGS